MTYTTILSTEDLAQNLDNPDWVIVDCRFALADTEKGRRAYEAAHIPGAVYAHLDNDLSGPIIPGKSSRHPLPSVANFAESVGKWGIAAGKQVVAYDDFGGAMAARLWWMLRWVGHADVAVLDGGWPAWAEEGRPTVSGIEQNQTVTFVARPRPEMIATADEILEQLDEGSLCLIDARTAERFRGEEEPLDPIAGHIPGAVNRPYPQNLANGRFRSKEELRAIFSELKGEKPSQEIVFYCGSGVTGTHNMLAMYHAGLGEARLYPGSWSEWITEPERPVATGE